MQNFKSKTKKSFVLKKYNFFSLFKQDSPFKHQLRFSIAYKQQDINEYQYRFSCNKVQSAAAPILIKECSLDELNRLVLQNLQKVLILDRKQNFQN